MSPESAALDKFRYAWEDVDHAHRAPHSQEVSFIERPQLFCAACGSATLQEVFGSIRREV